MNVFLLSVDKASTAVSLWEWRPVVIEGACWKPDWTGRILTFFYIYDTRSLWNHVEYPGKQLS